MIHTIWKSSLERVSALLDSFDSLNFSELVTHSLFFCCFFFGCKVTFLNLNCNSFSLADNYIGVYCMCFSYTNSFYPLNCLSFCALALKISLVGYFFLVCVMVLHNGVFFSAFLFFPPKLFVVICFLNSIGWLLQ